VPDDRTRPDLATLTSTHLLEGLRDAGDGSTWQPFVGRYRPLIVEYARRVGAAAHDAEDIAQQSLAAFADAYRRGCYQRDRGRLRDWLFGIVRRQMSNWYRRGHGREVLVGGGPATTGYFAEIEDEPAMRACWDAECRAAVLDACLDRVRREVHATTWDAFGLFACRGWTAATVAEHLAVSRDAVFGAKRRVLQRIRAVYPTVEAEW